MKKKNDKKGIKLKQTRKFVTEKEESKYSPARSESSTFQIFKSGSNTLRPSELEFNKSLLPQIQLPPKFIYPSSIPKLFNDYLFEPKVNYEQNELPDPEHKVIEEESKEQYEKKAKAVTEREPKKFRISSGTSRNKNKTTQIKREIRFVSKEFEEDSRRRISLKVSEAKKKNFSNIEHEVVGKFGKKKRNSLNHLNFGKEQYRRHSDIFTQRSNIPRQIETPESVRKEGSMIENDTSSCYEEEKKENCNEKFEEAILKRVNERLNDEKNPSLIPISQNSPRKQEESEQHPVTRIRIPTIPLDSIPFISESSNEEKKTPIKNCRTVKKLVNPTTSSINEIIISKAEEEENSIPVVREDDQVSKSTENLKFSLSDDKSNYSKRSETESLPISSNSMENRNENNYKSDKILEELEEMSLKKFERKKKLSLAKGTTIFLLDKKTTEFKFSKAKSKFQPIAKKVVKLRDMEKKKVAKTSKNLMNFVNSLDRFIRTNVSRKSVMPVAIKEETSNLEIDIQKILKKEKLEESKKLEMKKIQSMKMQDYTINIISPEGQKILEDKKKVPEQRKQLTNVSKFKSEESFQEKSIFQNSVKNSNFVKEYLTFFLEDVVVGTHDVKLKQEKKSFPRFRVSYIPERLASDLRETEIFQRAKEKKRTLDTGLNLKMRGESSDSLNMEEYSEESLEQNVKSDYEDDENLILLKNNKIASTMFSDEKASIEFLLEEQLKPVLNGIHEEKRLLIPKTRNLRESKGNEGLSMFSQLISS